MNKLGVWTKTHFTTLILAFAAGGFLLILAELLLERHWQGIQLVAPISAGVGFTLALLALTGRRGAPVIVLFLLLSVTGLFGTFEHFEDRTEPRGGPPEQAALTLQTVSTAAPTNPDGDFAGPPAGARRGGPPWLAPLSLSGLALLGGAATLAGGNSTKLRQTS